ncbi:ribonuclease H-like protein [Suillus plorans]|uniref:Ribonuclease H-like protein n=1 Tax=Suillus plorans TaxID=116603 RepID=A0A9P7DZC0_9AGAM|nr:ribonuclease H-like protein [Suillus plorans]KAG1806725.1 ribonuclease H-like protein [Suillus plorans]
MFSSLGLFQSLSCPQRNNCSRPSCIFSHNLDLPSHHSLDIPVQKVQPLPQTPSANVVHRAVPSKRPFHNLAQGPSSNSNGAPSGPPTQRLRVGTAQKPVAVPVASHTSTGVPIIRINPAQSQVALPVRQTLLKSLYEHFVVLYETILPSNPTLASEHALRQEEQVYSKSTKLTYRNAVINSIAALKRRPIPTSISHPSVGTEEDLAARAESKKKLNDLQVTRLLLKPIVMSLEAMQTWGFITEMPEGLGSDQPSAEGKIIQCERCTQSYMVKNDPTAEECQYHWGKLFTHKVNGERMRCYSCCQKPAEEGGCTRGHHVFYESKAEDLHSRHAFSFTRPSVADTETDTALDVVALDCEMIYTTGGMRVARVSVVDGSGKQVFDELVRMDDGVEVIDYNTRFSGITQEEHAQATLSLSSIRKSLDAFINHHTIIIGHALHNDLNTLRIIHHQCVDTAIIFPHRAGPPYRRSLRDLAKEHLGLTIQAGGGTSGHSSVEDSVATLDLVRWYVLNKLKPTAKT